MTAVFAPSALSRARAWLRVLAWLAVLGAGLGGPVLAAQAAEAAFAEDGGRVVLLATRLVSPARLAKLQAAARDAGVPLQTLSAEDDAPGALAAAVAGAALLVVDAPHEGAAKKAAARLGKTIDDSGVPYVLMGEADAVARGEPFAAAPLAAQRGVDAAWAQRLREYWRFAGGANLAASMAALRRIGVVEGLPAAARLPASGFHHPAWPRVEPGIGALDRLPGPAGAPTVAIAVHGAVFASDDTGWVDALIAALERRGLRAYAFYGPRQSKDLFFAMTHADAGSDAPRRVADLIVNAALVFHPVERKAELERIGVPVLQALPSLAMDAAQWERSTTGLAQADIASYYTPAELAGMVDPMLVTARDAASGALVPIPAQIEAVAGKAAALIHLRRTPPAGRRVAMLVYNEPWGEGHIGASFLNVPRSLHRMLSALRDAGYRTEAPDAERITRDLQATVAAFHRPETLRPLLDRGLAEALPLARYADWFRSLPSATQARIEARWGPPERSAMLREVGGERVFVIPRVRMGDAGHVVVLPQPPREEPSDGAARGAPATGHRLSTPLSHGYLATYLWLRERSGFGADALVHVGTHGSLEWAAGKERALSAQDDPLLALGDVPHVYPYIVDNLGEAMTAKRRGRAVLVSHATPMFVPAGFRPGVQDMHELMHDWENTAPGPLRQRLEARLLERFVEHQHHRDLQWTRERIAADFAGFMERLHPYLDELATTAQPLGLATFGEAPDARRRHGTILQILGAPLVEALGEDADEAWLLDARNLPLSRQARWLKAVLADADVDPVPGPRADAAALGALAVWARRLDALLADNREIDGFLAALDGRHLASGYGGDPVRQPDSLPTGRNLHGFDPGRIPTREAWDTAVAAMDAWIAGHAASHGGRPPEKIAFTLWAGETLRHLGVMESQVFYAMGARPRWDEAGRMAGIEILPREALGRPRMDVLVSVTGSYRDQFPAVMRWIDAAARQVSSLPEADNFIARHSEALEQRLTAQGATAAQARHWSTARVFSNAAGDYGSGLGEAVMATADGKTQDRSGGDARMARLYIDRMGHAQGEVMEGLARHDVYTAHLAQVDAALLSRSSHTYGLLTSDDAFQYLGGIALAVRQLTGRDPALYVQNLRDGARVRTEGADTAIAQEMQTRYLHPQWIAAQKAEGYSGALEVLRTARFLWGWQATAPQAVRQDHWQSLHDVYVRDRYRLGTREWLEGEHRDAFGQMLERMLDAMRLGHWQPDAATRHELARAYSAASKTHEAGDARQAPVRVAPRPVEVVWPPQAADTAHATATPTGAAPSNRVRGLRLEPLPAPAARRSDAASTPSVGALSVVLAILAVSFSGAWRQSRHSAGMRGKVLSSAIA